MRAAAVDELVGDNTMNVSTIVEAALCKVDEIRHRDWHLVEEELDADHLWLGSPEATGEGHLCRGVGAQAQRGQ